MEISLLKALFFVSTILGIIAFNLDKVLVFTSNVIKMYSGKGKR